MVRKQRVLLVIDGVINLVLGVLLVLFPVGVGAWLGMPPPATYFYTGILGAVLFGIGAALLIEWYGGAGGIRGLGIGGAIAINFCGAGALVAWLLTTSVTIPFRGTAILWTIAVLVLGVGVAEVTTKSWKHS